MRWIGHDKISPRRCHTSDGHDTSIRIQPSLKWKWQVLNKWIRWDKRFKHCFPHNLRASWDYQPGNLTGGRDDSYQLLIYSWLCLGACISNYNLSGLESQGADEDHNGTGASSLKNISLSLNHKEQRGWVCSVSFSHGFTIYLHFSPALHVHTIVTQIAWYCKQWLDILLFLFWDTNR